MAIIISFIKSPWARSWFLVFMHRHNLRWRLPLLWKHATVVFKLSAPSQRTYRLEIQPVRPRTDPAAHVVPFLVLFQESTNLAARRVCAGSRSISPVWSRTLGSCCSDTSSLKPDGSRLTGGTMWCRVLRGIYSAGRDGAHSSRNSFYDGKPLLGYWNDLSGAWQPRGSRPLQSRGSHHGQLFMRATKYGKEKFWKRAETQPESAVFVDTTNLLCN